MLPCCAHISKNRVVVLCNNMQCSSDTRQGCRKVWKSGGCIVIGRHNLPPLVEMGLTDLIWGHGPPLPPASDIPDTRPGKGGAIIINFFKLSKFHAIVVAVCCKNLTYIILFKIVGLLFIWYFVFFLNLSHRL